MKNTNETPIRIVKKKKGHQGAHGGAWKVAYADFVTAMMALFMVLWIVAQNKEVKANVAGYFKDPVAFFENVAGGGSLGGGKSIENNLSVDEMLKRAKEENQKLEEMGKTILKDLEKDSTLGNLMSQIMIEVVDEGLRIELLEASQSFFFDIGTAAVKPEAIRILSVIAQDIGKMPNKVIVEGHTDSRKYSRIDSYTNFELSADRANSARRVLSVRGLRENQISEIRGYADTRLRNINDPFDVTNRRISIIIKKEEGGGAHEQKANHSRSGG